MVDSQPIFDQKALLQLPLRNGAKKEAKLRPQKHLIIFHCSIRPRIHKSLIERTHCGPHPNSIDFLPGFTRLIIKINSVNYLKTRDKMMKKRLCAIAMTFGLTTLTLQAMEPGVSIRELLESGRLPEIEVKNERKTLDLSNRRINSLDGLQEIPGIKTVEALDLSNNKLQSLLEGVFAGLNELQELSLSGNNLESLPEGVFAGLNRLWRLYLNNNQLRELPERVFAGLDQLQRLYLNNNQLRELPERVFAGLDQLMSLSLYNNQLQSLPEGVFAGLNQLQDLDLHYNQLRELPERVFAGLNQLKFFLFSNFFNAQVISNSTTMLVCGHKFEF